MSNNTGNWLNAAVFGHMEHYNRSNVAPTESHKMSEHNIFLLQPFEYQQIYIKDRPSQISVQWSYCLFWTMPTTLSITQLYRSPICTNQTKHLSDRKLYNRDRRTSSHHGGDVCSYHNDIPFKQYIPPGIMVGALFCPIWQIFPDWLHCTLFRRQCCFRLTTILENCHHEIFLTKETMDDRWYKLRSVWWLHIKYDNCILETAAMYMNIRIL